MDGFSAKGSSVFRFFPHLFLLLGAMLLACHGPEPTVSDCYPEGECASVRHAPRKRPFSAEGGDLAKGSRLYLKNCVGCHAENGKGVATYDTQDLTVPAWHELKTDGQIRKLILEGKFKMPPFDLTQEELKDLIAYIRQFDRSRHETKDTSPY